MTITTATTTKKQNDGSDQNECWSSQMWTKFTKYSLWPKCQSNLFVDLCIKAVNENLHNCVICKIQEVVPHAGSGVVKIDPLHFLAGCPKRQQNQV